mmetsp:Transcript_100180/g.188766  ORF Transcript_100180/g.188766 Transcript_100180/m.188766 type:complete len:926 (-) Transcript_100180:121-2898(-)
MQKQARARASLNNDQTLFEYPGTHGTANTEPMDEEQSSKKTCSSLRRSLWFSLCLLFIPSASTVELTNDATNETTTTTTIMITKPKTIITLMTTITTTSTRTNATLATSDTSSEDDGGVGSGFFVFCAIVSAMCFFGALFMAERKWIQWLHASGKESEKKRQSHAGLRSHLTRHGRLLEEDGNEVQEELSAEEKYGSSHIDMVRSHAARAALNPNWPKSRGEVPEHLMVVECEGLKEFFKSDRYLKGLPCTVKGYAEQFFDFGETKAGVFLHGPSGIQVWQYALELCSKMSRSQLKEVFSRHDQNNTGSLSMKELGKALRELAFQPSEQELLEIIEEHSGDCVREDEFIRVVERKYRDQRGLFFHYTDERGFRLVADPSSMKVGDLWGHLTNQDGYFGPGLYVNSKAPDEWDGQWEIQVNNLWPRDAEQVAKVEGAAHLLPLAEQNRDMNIHCLVQARRGAASFCIPVMAYWDNTRCCNTYENPGLPRSKSDPPWRDCWLIDMSFQHGIKDALRNIEASVDALANVLINRIQRREPLFGTNDQDTACIVDYLGTFRMERGRSQKAEVLFRRAFTSRVNSLNWNHVDTIASARKLGLSLQKAGQLAEADQLLRYAFERRSELLGFTHTDTLRSAAELISLLREKDVCNKGFNPRDGKIYRFDKLPEHLMGANMIFLSTPQPIKDREIKHLLQQSLEACEDAVKSKHPHALEMISEAAPIFDYHSQITHRTQCGNPACYEGSHCRCFHGDRAHVEELMNRAAKTRKEGRQREAAKVRLSKTRPSQRPSQLRAKLEKEAAAGKAMEVARRQSELAGEVNLVAKLHGLKIAALKNRAREVHIPDEDIQSAAKAENPKQSLIDLILEKRRDEYKKAKVRTARQFGLNPYEKKIDLEETLKVDTTDAFRHRRDILKLMTVGREPCAPASRM